jgi:hypothetical protein
MAVNGDVRVHTEILETEIEIIETIGTGATSTVSKAIWSGREV